MNVDLAIGVIFGTCGGVLLAWLIDTLKPPRCRWCRRPIKN